MLTVESLRLLLGSPIAFHRVFADVAGGALPGLFLSQCWYWSGRTTDPDGWFYKGREEWTAETGMTRTEQETAREKLRKRGILEEQDGRGTDRRVYFRINTDALIAAIEALTPVSDRPENRRSIGGKPTYGTVENPPMERQETNRSIGGKPAHPQLENTTEITPETTAKTRTPVKVIEGYGPVSDAVAGLLTAYRQARYPDGPGLTRTELREYGTVLRDAAIDGVTPEQMYTATIAALERFSRSEMVNPRSVVRHLADLLKPRSPRPIGGQTAPQGKPQSLDDAVARQAERRRQVEESAARQEGMPQ